MLTHLMMPFKKEVVGGSKIVDIRVVMEGT